MARPRESNRSAWVSEPPCWWWSALRASPLDDTGAVQCAGDHEADLEAVNIYRLGSHRNSANPDGMPSMALLRQVCKAPSPTQLGMMASVRMSFTTRPQEPVAAPKAAADKEALPQVSTHRGVAQDSGGNRRMNGNQGHADWEALPITVLLPDTSRLPSLMFDVHAALRIALVEGDSALLSGDHWEHRAPSSCWTYQQPTGVGLLHRAATGGGPVPARL